MGEEKMEELSQIEREAFKAVQSALESYVAPERLVTKRNKQPHYFTIRLDDRRELCYIVRKLSSEALSYIGCNRINIGHFNEKISSPKDILSDPIKSKLVYKLKAIAQEEHIPLDTKVEFQNKEESIVWHYTKMDALEKIFLPKEPKKDNEDKIRLRFTNIQFLNDPSEGLVLRKFFEDHREEIANSLPEKISKDLREIILKEPITDEMINLSNKYTFSTSKQADSFAFWNKEYAGLDGVAIGFNNVYLCDLEKDNCRIETINYINLYGEEKEFIKDFVTHISSDAVLVEVFSLENTSSPKEILSGVIDSLSCIYKQKSWECEKEVRIIMDKTPDTKIIFNGNDVKKCCYEYFDAYIVSRIMLGPKCNDNQVKAVEEYLKENGYNNIHVDKSRAYELRN